MKKNIMKKMIISILSLSLVFGFSGTVKAAHAANGADVIPSNLRWNSFSICTREDGGAWEDSLKKVFRTNSDGTYFLDENGQKVTFVKGTDYATEGWINGNGDNSPQEVIYYCKNSGWDGEYSNIPGVKSVLVGDNPWGMTLTMDGISVEFGRYYTMEFDLAGDLQEVTYDNIEQKTTYEPKAKHILLKAYDYNSTGGPSAAFERVEQDGEEVSKDGYITVKETPKGETPTPSHIVATFKIPDTADEWGGGKHKGSNTHVGIKFAMGANLVSYPKEGGMRGNIYITNMKMKAGTQHIVRYYDGNKVKASRYVNHEESAKSIKLSNAGKTLAGYLNKDTGKRYDFSTALLKDLNLKAIWSKTLSPNKASFKVKSKKKKKEEVTFGANKNIRGYQVKYSYSKSFKKKSKFKTKTKNCSNTLSYTIRSLKSKKVVYVKARGYNLDSVGNKIYGAWSGTQAAYVR